MNTDAHLVVSLDLLVGPLLEQHPAGEQGHDEPMTRVPEHDGEEEREGSDGEQC